MRQLYNPSVIFFCGLAIFAACLLRILLAGDFRLLFIVWNIILAAVPLLLVPVFRTLGKYGKSIWVKAGQLATGFLWLLFLPNAFYILTDFMHLNSEVLVNARNDYSRYGEVYERGDGLFIYDSLLLFAATFFGAYVGGLALVQAYNYFKKRISKQLVYLAIASIMVLCAAGVYIGRFGRWNSWEGLTHPHTILMDLFDNLITSETRGRFLILVFTIIIFQLASFAFIYYQQKSLSHARKAGAK